MRFALLLLTFKLILFSSAVKAADYCLALRGNGDLMPAHWGAVSALVEKVGLPQIQAGGSSASITMFLIDAVASHPLVKNSSGEARSLRASLMIKSFEGFVEFLKTTDQFKDFLGLLEQGDWHRRLDWITHFKTKLESGEQLSQSHLLEFLRENEIAIRKNFQIGIDLGLIGPANYRPLFEALKVLTGQAQTRDLQLELRRAIFYLGELKQAVAALGAFNAQTDHNLFFRMGLVNFDRLADSIGLAGQFYSAQGASEQEMRSWQEWLDHCGALSIGQTWSGVSRKDPSCSDIFVRMVKDHFATDWSNDFVHLKVGQAIVSLPVTSVLTGASYARAREAMQRYHLELDPAFGKDFDFYEPSSVKIGYWGPTDVLQQVRARLPIADEKSSRFIALGHGSWWQAMRLSPAEPGLSALRPFRALGQDLISAGGWADLAPVLVLKAAGCDQVVYVTRRGGESLFAQGVGKRILGFDRSWEFLQTGTEAGRRYSRRINNNGDPEDMTSLWSRLYNLANPNSSLRRALNAADAILCTSWDRFELRGGLSPMIEDSYNSPYYVKPKSRLYSTLRPHLDPTQMHESGDYLEHAGCL